MSTKLNKSAATLAVTLDPKLRAEVAWLTAYVRQLLGVKRFTHSALLRMIVPRIVKEFEEAMGDMEQLRELRSSVAWFAMAADREAPSVEEVAATPLRPFSEILAQHARKSWKLTPWQKEYTPPKSVEEQEREIEKYMQSEEVQTFLRGRERLSKLREIQKAEGTGPYRKRTGERPRSPADAPRNS